MYRTIGIILIVNLLAGCSSLSHESADNGITPNALVGNKALAEKGTSLTWGGEIVAVENFSNNSVLQIVAYPLRDSGEPRADRTSLGRFLADKQGFLEPREFRPGRRVTITGPLLGFQDKAIGEAVLPLPALDVQQIQLWSENVGFDNYYQPRVNVGVSGGSGGGRVGVGLGF